MKKSIRFKLFMGISFIVLCFILLSWFLNNTALEKYYLYEKKNILLQDGKNIDSLYTGNSKDVSLDLERLENLKGVNITIINKNQEIVYSSFSRIINAKIFNRKTLLPPKGNEEKLPPSPPGLGNLDDIYHLFVPPETENIRYIFRIQKDSELKVDFLALRYSLKNGDTLLLRTPLAAISESASIANKFMLFTGIVIFIFSCFWAFFFSKNFTKPILELKNIAQSIGKLDFSKKCIIKSEDEIGELGKSINFLSFELSNAIEELNEKNKKLLEDIEKERKIDEMRKEFVSSVSHELKTPIALIQGYAEGLKLNVIESEEDKAFYCNVIIDESDRMNTLVKNLLNLSQIESGYFQIEKSIFNLSSLIDQVLNKFRGVFEQNHIHCNVEKAETIVAEGDLLRIEQVLVNYINNAIHHVDTKKILNINVLSVNAKIRVSVFNSGNLIPKDSLDKIWLSFYKVDKARTRTYGGSGLGLSIVKGIQELHANAYGVENVEDGVLFWFDVDPASSLDTSS